jgi:hypothetical protein
MSGASLGIAIAPDRNRVFLGTVQNFVLDTAETRISRLPRPAFTQNSNHSQIIHLSGSYKGDRPPHISTNLHNDNIDEAQVRPQAKDNNQGVERIHENPK